MKIINKNYVILMAVVLLLLGACKDGLDYKNVSSISPDNVWSDPKMINAYLNDVYGGCMPGWPLGSGQNSDEGIGGDGTNLGNFQQGVITVASQSVNLNYTWIDKTNFFMDQMAKVPSTVMDDNLKARLVAEAKFWRAWAYWGYVSSIGGVPLILKTQDATNFESLKVPRAKTSECIAQIVKDLDEATQVLPSSYTGADYGRINKAAALGLKGRVLMWWASPLFNPSNDQTRWTNAYNATKAAVDEANAAGFGLLDKYRSIWYSGNKEMIMVNQYWYPDHYANFAPIRAEPFSNGAANSDQPTLNMLLAFPKKDGSPMQFDQNQLGNPVYNAQFLKDFYTNRDARFYATIFFSGIPYPTPDLQSGQSVPRSWSFWNVKYWNSAVTPSFILPMQDKSKYSVISEKIYNYGGNHCIAGFYDRKGLDTTITKDVVYNGVAAGAKSWWSPMRYAELLMNYGECANEVGKSTEALQVLYNIRKRAEINQGLGNYGVTASSQTGIRDAYIAERRVEFAFENFRLNDLRRWKRYDILNDQVARHGLLIILKPGETYPLLTDNILTPAIRAKFDAVYVDNLDAKSGQTPTFKLDLNHWFNALAPAQISIEPDQLPQNKEWGGTFDPLQ